MDGAIETIREEETVFWDELIKMYLFPLEGNKKEQEKTQSELLELRFVLFSYLALNSVIAVYRHVSFTVSGYFFPSGIIGLV